MKRQDESSDSRLRRISMTAGLSSPRTLERETGFEPATSTLARLHSTTELLPHRNMLFILCTRVLSTGRVMEISNLQMSRCRHPLRPKLCSEKYPRRKATPGSPLEFMTTLATSYRYGSLETSLIRR